MALGEYWTHVCIIQKGVAVFSRDLTLWGNDITENLREHLKLSFSEAESLMMSSFKEKQLPQETLEIIERSGQALCHEIQQSLNLYMSQHPETQIDKIYLSGGPSKIPPLRDWITEGTGIETELLKPFEQISYNKNRWQPHSIDEIEAISPIALGLATRSPKE